MTLFVSEAAIDHPDSAFDAAPGVEVVLRPATDTPSLDAQTLKWIGALHRRMWNRRDTMMRRRTLEDARDSTVIDLTPLDGQRQVLCDLVDAQTWQQRLNSVDIARRALSTATADYGSIVLTRGWNESEAGVLVDGRPVIAPVFDVAIMLSSALDEFRRGESPFSFVVPAPDDADAATLWDELMTVAQDRLGIERGTVRHSSRVEAI